MYKKILKMCFILVNIIAASLWLVYIISQYNNTEATKEFDLTNDYAQLGFPKYQTTNDDYRKQLKAIQKTSDELNVPYMKRTYYLGSGTNYEEYDYNRHTQNVLFEVSDLNTTALKNNFGINFENGEKYSTKDLDGVKHLKKYSNVDFTIEQISLKKSPFSREGVFFIQTHDVEIINKYLSGLRYNYNKAFKTHYNINDFKPAQIYTVSDDLSLDSEGIKSMAKTMMIFQMAFFIIYSISFIYEIGVYKLLGYRTLMILKKILLPELISSFIFVLIIGTIYELVNNDISIVWNSFSVLVLILTAEIAYSLLLIAALQHISTNMLLIKRSYTGYLFKVSFVVKGILLIYLLSAALPLADVEYQLMKTVKEPQVTSYKKYTNFFPKVQGYNEEQSPMKMTRLQQRVLYPQLDKIGALYIDTSQIMKENKPYQRNVDININYLNFDPLYDIKGNKINISKKEKRPIILLPLKNLKFKKQILSSYDQDLQPELILMKNNQTIFNTKGHKISNFAYINVVTNKNLSSDTILDIFTGEADDTVKIPLNNQTPAQIYKKVKPLLQKYNLEDNLPQLIRADQSKKADFANAVGEVYADIFVIMVSVIMFIIISIVMLYLYFSVYGNRFAIKQTLGISRLKSMLGYWGLWILQVVIVLIVLTVFIQKIIDPPVYLLFSSAVVLDFFISIIGLKIFSKKAIERFLNE